jgi:hypothetical protein
MRVIEVAGLWRGVGVGGMGVSEGGSASCREGTQGGGGRRKQQCRCMPEVVDAEPVLQLGLGGWKPGFPPGFQGNTPAGSLGVCNGCFLLPPARWASGLCSLQRTLRSHHVSHPHFRSQACQLNHPHHTQCRRIGSLSKASVLLSNVATNDSWVNQRLPNHSRRTDTTSPLL